MCWYWYYMAMLALCVGTGIISSVSVSYRSANMKAKSFKHFLSQLNLLTPRQRHQLVEFASGQSSLESLEIIERHDQHARDGCPFCQSSATIRWGKSHELQRYRCKACGKTFTPMTGSPLSKLHYKCQWLRFSECLLASRSVRKSAKICGIDPSTAFRWRHRFLLAFSQDKTQKMVGIVEADETFFTQSSKGDRYLTRPPRKRGKSMKNRIGERVPVLIVRDRTGTEADFIFEKVEKAAVHKCLASLMSDEVVLCSDGSSLYTTFAKDAHIPHKRIVRSAGVFVVDDIFHIQNLNAYVSRLKQWLQHFNGVATKYLDNYLGWRRMLEKGEVMSEKIILKLALGENYQHVMRT